MKIDKLDIKVSKKSEYKVWLRNCYDHAQRSNHPGTHNASLLINKDKVVLRGVNNLPPGVKKLKQRLEGGNKHIYFNHAERDVIYKAARRGLATEGLTMVMPWLPCIPCANAVISAGIKRLIIHKQMVERTKRKWWKELRDAVQIMREAGIEIIAYDGLVGKKAYMHSKEWNA
ncbi:MAG: hypothetical protein ISS23_03115 [Nanoarchaeota archaeon]|nr:hypothetical protein [Nanoarchaeota archaeon]